MMPPPGAMPPPGVAGPGPIPPRSVGGRAYARGGTVTSAAGKNADTAGIGKGRTKVQHDDQMPVVKANMNRKPVITKAKGGPINANGKAGQQMGPKFSGGARGGTARMEKADRARKTYAKA